MLQATIAEIAARVGPSVAGLGRGWGRGSGVVFARDRVITNAHVLRGADVALSLGHSVAHGRVTGVDRRRDLAVIAVDTRDAAPVPPAPERPGIGALVFALADPGGRGLRVTHGHVTSDARRMIEHTAPLPRGASGGPLVDEQGRLLGLNTARLEGGFILAAPFDLQRAEALARGEEVAQPELGVALGRGMIVRAVKDASPAAVAGVRPGDRCIAVDDVPLRSLDELLDAVEAAKPFTLTVLRDGEQHDLGLKLQ
jgi:S1-C subfamily serine protease